VLDGWQGLQAVAPESVGVRLGEWTGKIYYIATYKTLHGKHHLVGAHLTNNRSNLLKEVANPNVTK
jgi:hypothetical protein